MLTQRALNDLGIGSILEFYEYIMKLKEEGNEQSSKEFFQMLSKRNKEDFFIHLEETELYPQHYISSELRGFFNE